MVIFTPPKKKKSSIRDFALKLLGTFSHTLEDTALFVRPDYRPQGYGLERVKLKLTVLFFCVLSDALPSNR